ncbi:MAG: hypothetical protein JSU73_06815 [candidate division WOR-3 bacterium]|nr:MAG: hypothetical protein JSU73_06815 [candidate division WOR-3 bacterium]
MGAVHIVNVVHTEPDWWDGGLAGIDVGLPALLERFGDIEQKAGARIPVTWCLFFNNDYRSPEAGRRFSDVVSVRADFFHSRLELDDEVGIHTHALDPRRQHLYFQDNAQRLAEAGFPYPRTHAPGWFYLDGNVFRALERAGIETDAGLLVGAGRVVGRQPLVKGILLQDATGRERSDPSAFRPYHPAPDCISRPGSSAVVEVPVFLSSSGVAEDPEGHVGAIRNQWLHRDEVEVEVVQLFWHPWELVEQGPGGGVNRAVVDGLAEVMSAVVGWDDVVFSTVHDAVTRWGAAVTR